MNWTKIGISPIQTLYPYFLLIFARSRAMVSRSPKWWTFSQLTSGCIFTSLMLLYCSQIESGSSMIFEIRTKSRIASA